VAATFGSYMKLHSRVYMLYTDIRYTIPFATIPAINNFYLYITKNK